MPNHELDLLQAESDGRKHLIQQLDRGLEWLQTYIKSYGPTSQEVLLQIKYLQELLK